MTTRHAEPTTESAATTRPSPRNFSSQTTLCAKHLDSSSKHPSAVWLTEYRLLHGLFLLPAMFGPIVVMRLFREKNILTQICGNNFLVLKAAPPLTVASERLDQVVRAIRDIAVWLKIRRRSGPRY